MKVWIFTAVVRFQSEGPHHRDGMEEQNHVTYERIGSFLATNHLEVGPHELTQQPGGATGSEQHPERTGSALLRSRVHEKAGACEAGG